MRMRCRLLLMGVVSGVACLGLGQGVLAQAVPRDNYLRFLPLTPRIVTQTEASARLHLYGDAAAPGFRDAGPADGIDDARAERLLLLAERFSPLLRRNNTSVPRSVDRALGGRQLLYADTWVDGHLVRTDSLDLGLLSAEMFYGAGAPGASPAPPRAAAATVAETRELIDELRPSRTEPRIVPAAGEVERVLFFDIPGSDEPSWRATLDKGRPRDSRIYAHFFIYESPQEFGAERRYCLVVQYWFFYPFNDGPNNHEGDWEHINVSITTRERAATGGLLSEQDVRVILDGGPEVVDSLTIHLVEYYVHEYIVVLDYPALLTKPDVSRTPHSEHSTTHIWEDADFAKRIVTQRVAVAGGRLATHPVGYIGGDSKGPDELLHVLPRFRLSYNRNSDATYPFPGVWARVGPAHATEKVYGSAVPRVHRDDPGTLPWYRLIDDNRFETYRRDNITLLPDWERVERLVVEDPAARQQWIWLVLPIRLGYPASRSPGAGIIRRADGGNISPLAPSFNPSWNRLGTSYKYELLDPAVLRVAGAPVTPWAMVQNGWGVLNYPMAVMGLLPNANVALTQLVPWATGGMNLLGAPPARTFTRDELPPRITSAGQGLAYQFGGHDFARLLPRARDAAAPVLAARGGGASPTSYQEVGFHRTAHSGPRLWFNLYYGRRVSVENTFMLDTSSLSYTVVADGQALGTVRGRMVMRELTGGFRYNGVSALHDALQLYARGGYAWTEYRIRNIRLGPHAFPASQGGYLPTLLPSSRWWPNTTYVGAGIEVFAPKRHWILHRLGYGARAEVGLLRHRLDRKACGTCSNVAERGDAAMSLVFGW